MVRAARHFAALCLLLACGLASTAFAARLTCRISDVSPSARSLMVECAVSDFAPAAKLELRFAEEFAGVSGLSERVFALGLKDADGRQLKPEIFGGGVYRVGLAGARGGSPSVTLSYELRLARALNPGQYALVSSLGPESGFILLSDALPQVQAVGADGEGRREAAPVRVQLRLPDGWQAATAEEQRGEFYEVADAGQAVFFVGRLRTETRRVGEMELQTARAGAWSFSDEQAAHLAAEIAREQAAMVAARERGRFLVTLAPFPLPLTGLRSTALTRGRTVILLLNPDTGSDAAARTLKHYQKHLAHEMFHFYLPGAFRIGENFDWFWEGFTRYTALATLLRLKLIDTRDYLDAIGEEYEAYAANPARLRTSLIEASADKFASGENYDLVYRKGTLVAALYDLSLRWQSGGKRSVADVMRALYRDYAHATREVGNREVTGELSRAGDFGQFIADYISGTREIDLAASVKPYGWVIEQSAATRGRARLSVAPKLSDKQRALLSALTQ